jgi:hypothetical protein
MEFDERADVAQAQVVGAAGHARDRGDGARAYVDADGQPFILVVALGERQEERRRLAGHAEVQRELDRREALRPRGGQGDGTGEGGGEEVAALHGGGSEKRAVGN